LFNKELLFNKAWPLLEQFQFVDRIEWGKNHNLMKGKQTNESLKQLNQVDDLKNSDVIRREAREKQDFKQSTPLMRKETKGNSRNSWVVPPLLKAATRGDPPERAHLYNNV
jgi:hypothetical protein